MTVTPVAKLENAWRKDCESSGWTICGEEVREDNEVSYETAASTSKRDDSRQLIMIEISRDGFWFANVTTNT
jgi:hypothetical protein